jgi:hypothetical protein
MRFAMNHYFTKYLRVSTAKSGMKNDSPGIWGAKHSRCSWGDRLIYKYLKCD